MPGQAIITLNENQWTVSLATTYAELTTGLREVASLAAGTGMLFILPTTQAPLVDTTGMNFALDIIFIANNVVIDVARNIEPGYLVTEETPCDSFLEVNAGEAVDVEVGDTVSTTATQEPGFDWSTLTSFAIPLALLGFVCAMAGGMMKGITGSSSSSSVRRLGKPRGKEERAGVHEEFYGTRELPPRGTGLKEREESEEGRRLGEPKTKEERGETHLAKYGSKELPERGKGQEKVTVRCPICEKEIEVGEYDSVTRTEALRKHIEKEHRAGHHSMWLNLEQRKDLEKKYGAVAVRWAEEATKPGDIEAADKAAAYYYRKIREYFALGHGSPELTEEQIERLREILGLPKEVTPREKGYIE
ncbi:hypothetical protein ES703_113745 [subsurface metagenome]